MKINWKAIPEALKIAGKFGEKHLPEILTGLGVAGFVGTAILAAKQAPKAQTAIKKAELEKAERENPGEIELPKVKLTLWETIKAVAGYYVAPVALGGASTFCIFKAQDMRLKDITSLSMALYGSRKELKDLQDKIIEKDGKEKLKEYEKEIHEPEIQRFMSDYGDTNIYNTGKGTTIFFDPTIGMAFYCNLFTVEKAIGHMVQGCKDGDSYPLSAFRHEIGLPRNDNEGDYHFYYEFVRDTISDVEDHNYKDYFEYHSLNPEEGDNRSCIWITIPDYIAHKREDDRDGVPFRYR